MHILYENKKIESYFIDGYAKMNKCCDYILAKKIKKIENWLMASPTFFIYQDTGLGKVHSLSGDLEGNYGINITGNYRLVVCPLIAERSPEALKNCDTILVKGAVDYHDGKYNWIIP